MSKLLIPRVSLTGPTEAPVQIQIAQTILNLHTADAYVLFKALRRLHNAGAI